MSFFVALGYFEAETEEEGEGENCRSFVFKMLSNAGEPITIKLFEFLDLGQIIVNETKKAENRSRKLAFLKLLHQFNDKIGTTYDPRDEIAQNWFPEKYSKYFKLTCLLNHSFFATYGFEIFTFILPSFYLFCIFVTFYYSFWFLLIILLRLMLTVSFFLKWALFTAPRRL